MRPRRTTAGAFLLTVALLAPAVEGRKGEYRKLIEDVQRKGFESYRVDGTEYSVDDRPALRRR
jgi:excinuclease ABC subunit A